MKKMFKTQSGRFFAGLIAFLLAAAAMSAVSGMGALRWDITPWGVMTMSSESMEIVRSLESDIEIYYLATDAGKDIWVDELARKYDACSDRITYRMVDPASSRPADLSAQAGTSLNENSLVIASEKRTTSIAADLLYEITYNQMYYYYYGEYVADSQKFVADSELANAILYVTRDDLPVIYQLTGHGETAVMDTSLTTIRMSNIILNTLSLDGSGVPEDAAALIINAPTSDLSGEEADALLSYLRNGGKLILNTGYETRGLTNLNRVMAYYGMKPVEGIVLDAAAGYCYSAEYPYYLTPAIADHEITADLYAAQSAVLVSYAGAVKRSAYSRSTLTVSPLLTTSEQAFVKTAAELETLEQEEGDLTGAQTVAMAAEDGDTRVVWCTGWTTFSEENIQGSSGMNLYLLKGIIGWMVPIGERLSIESSELMSQALSVGSGMQAVVYAALFVPALIMLIVGSIMKSRKPRIRK